MKSLYQLQIVGASMFVPLTSVVAGAGAGTCHDITSFLLVKSFPCTVSSCKLVPNLILRERQNGDNNRINRRTLL
jgi:hypothetical protein